MAAIKTAEDVKYLRTDEWVRVEGSTATIGISDFAQDQLNDVVYVELPMVGDTLEKSAPFGMVESVKAASELIMPVGGKITAVNTDLEKKPELVNSDPYGAGWMLRIEITDGDNAALMDAAAYTEYCKTR